MKIVIEIPEETFKYYVTLANKGEQIGNLERIILDGTPLPKGHGRLGDLDALEKEMINGIKAGNYEEGYERFPHINDMDDCVECVNYADTIIEADKEGVIVNAKNRNDKTCCQTLSRQKETMFGDRARESRVDFGNISK